MTQGKSRGYWYFALFNLMPLFVLVARLVYSSFSINMQNLLSTIAFWILFLPLVFSPSLFLLFICYKLFRVCQTWFQRGILLYVFWVIVIFCIAYFNQAMMTGISMAYVDSDRQGRHLMEAQDLVNSLRQVMFFHIFIIPWVIFCIYRFKKSMANVFDRPAVISTV